MRKVEQLFVTLSDTLLTLAKKAQAAERYQVLYIKYSHVLSNHYSTSLFPSLSQVAEGALFSLHHLHNSRDSYSIPEFLCPSLSWKHQLQEARLYWDRGETSLALSQLHGLLQRMKAVREDTLEHTHSLSTLTHSAHSHTHSYTHSLTHSLTYTLTHSLTHPLTHSLTHTFSPAP